MKTSNSGCIVCIVLYCSGSLCSYDNCLNFTIHFNISSFILIFKFAPKLREFTEQMSSYGKQKYIRYKCMDLDYKVGYTVFAFVTLQETVTTLPPLTLRLPAFDFPVRNGITSTCKLELCTTSVTDHSISHLVINV